MWIRRSFSTGKNKLLNSPRIEIARKRKDEGGILKALEAYDRMQREGIKPSVPGIVAALKACISSRDLKQGTRIHIDCGNDSNIFVQSTLVDMYAKCGNMSEARRVFNAIPHPNVVSWTVIIWGYAQTGDFDKALQLFRFMQEKGVPPNARTFVAAIKACTGLAMKEDAKQVDEKLVKVSALERGRDLHFQLAEKRYEADSFVASALVDMYSKCGSMKDAQKVFDRMQKRDVFSWTAMILGYSRSGDGERALELFSKMQDEGFVPDGRTFLAAVNSCTCLAAAKEIEGNKQDCLARGAEIHSQLAKNGYESDIFVASALVDMYAKCGSMKESRRVFDGMKQRNLVSWTAVILGYVQSGEVEIALQIFARMQDEGFIPNARTYVAALKACAAMGDSALERGRAIHRQLSKQDLDLDVFVGNSLVDMYSKCGSVSEARQVFDKMPSHSVVSWNALVMAYAQAGEGEQALEIFERMKAEGCCVPDVLTYVSALKACSSLAALEIGRQIHDEIRQSGCEGDSLVANSLISFYGKCGSLIEAQEVFDSVSKRDVVTWSALIAGYGGQGNTEQAFDLLERMQNEERLQPDAVTFLSILTACSHAGLVDKGNEFFQAMRSDYGISPSIEHYAVMVDLLGRANHLDEALSMLKSMPYEPNSTVWTTVLASCRKWKNVRVAKQAFEELVKLDEGDSAAYVLMAETYAGAGMWEESAEVNLMRTKTFAERGDCFEDEGDGG